VPSTAEINQPTLKKNKGPESTGQESQAKDGEEPQVGKNWGQEVERQQRAKLKGGKSNIGHNKAGSL